jgi:hypothetical protein
VLNARKKLFNYLLPTGQQHMDVTPLGYTRTKDGTFWIAIPLNQRDALKVLCKDTRCQEPCYTSAENDRVFP